LRRRREVADLVSESFGCNILLGVNDRGEVFKLTTEGNQEDRQGSALPALKTRQYIGLNGQ
jgi:hypothetical protein